MQGATIYISGLPVCSECAKGLIQVGVKRVVYKADVVPKKWAESGADTINLFKEAGIEYDRV